MSMLHSSEPWTIVLNRDNRVEVRDSEGATVMVLSAPDGDLEKLFSNAARLMVCTNVCCGVPTDVIEHVLRGTQGKSLAAVH